MNKLQFHNFNPYRSLKRKRSAFDQTIYRRPSYKYLMDIHRCKKKNKCYDSKLPIEKYNRNSPHISKEIN